LVAPSSPGSNPRTSSFKRPKSAWCFQQTSLKVYLCISLFSQFFLSFSLYNHAHIIVDNFFVCKLIRHST
jgi:hypothetical protein